MSNVVSLSQLADKALSRNRKEALATIAAEAPLIPTVQWHGHDDTHGPVPVRVGLRRRDGRAPGGLPFLRVHHDDAKIALTGRAKGVTKAAMKAVAAEKKLSVSTEHEADAIGVALHAFEVFFPKSAAA